jgi:hypothetical protein
MFSSKLQGFGAAGADDLTGKPGIYQVRDPADVIDVGMGQVIRRIQQNRCRSLLLPMKRP